MRHTPSPHSDTYNTILSHIKVVSPNYDTSLDGSRISKGYLGGREITHNACDQYTGGKSISFFGNEPSLINNLS